MHSPLLYAIIVSIGEGNFTNPERLCYEEETC
nr:hypothetical protein AOJQRVMU_AOJQRVMU_CDS_0006 [Microvirus sp.]